MVMEFHVLSSFVKLKINTWNESSYGIWLKILLSSRMVPTLMKNSCSLSNKELVQWLPQHLAGRIIPDLDVDLLELQLE